MSTLLASEDQSEKGLCPHRPVDVEIPLSRPEPSYKSAEQKKKVSRSSEDLLRNPVDISNDVSSYNGVVRAPSAKIDLKLRSKTTHPEATSLVREAAGNEDGKKATNKPDRSAAGRREKDTKSFAQILFDTATMKILQYTTVAEKLFQLAGQTSGDYCDNSSEQSILQSDSDISRSGHHNGIETTIEKRVDTGETTGSDKSFEYCNYTNESQKAVLLSDSAPLGPVSNNSSSEACSFKAATKLNPRSAWQPGEDQTTNITTAPIALPDASNGRIATTQNPLQPSVIGVEKHSLTRKKSANSKAQKGRYNDMYLLSNGVKCSTVPRPQCLSHLSIDNVKGLIATVSSNYSDLFNEHHLLLSQGRTDVPLCACSHTPGEVECYKAFLTFSEQSITYVLSNTEALMQSFLHNISDTGSPMGVLPYEFPLMVSTFRLLRAIDFHPFNILPSLWTSVGYIHPLRPSRKRESSIASSLQSPTSFAKPLEDVEVFHVAKIAFAAVVASVPICNIETMNAVAKLRASGNIAPNIRSGSSLQYGEWLEKFLGVVDCFEDEMALSVVRRLVMGIVAQECEPRPPEGNREPYWANENVIVDTITYLEAGYLKILVGENQPSPSLRGAKWVNMYHSKSAEALQQPFSVIVEWLRTLIVKEWDGKAHVSWRSTVGGALRLLTEICKCSLQNPNLNMRLSLLARRPWLGIDGVTLYTPCISERMELMEAPIEWAASDQPAKCWHMLDFPRLFPPSVLVSYFRAINYDTMYKAFESAATAQHIAARVTFPNPFTNHGPVRLPDKLKVAQTSYLVLEIHREDVLKDAMDQIWRREKRELMRPLKVRMGTEEGEEGEDHGGVQQEFIRIAIAEALDPKYGKAPGH